MRTLSFALLLAGAKANASDATALLQGSVSYLNPADDEAGNVNLGSTREKHAISEMEEGVPAEQWQKQIDPYAAKRKQERKDMTRKFSVQERHEKRHWKQNKEEEEAFKKAFAVRVEAIKARKMKEAADKVNEIMKHREEEFMKSIETAKALGEKHKQEEIEYYNAKYGAEAIQEEKERRDRQRSENQAKLKAQREAVAALEEVERERKANETAAEEAVSESEKQLRALEAEKKEAAAAGLEPWQLRLAKQNKGETDARRAKVEAENKAYEQKLKEEARELIQQQKSALDNARREKEQAEKERMAAEAEQEALEQQAQEEEAMIKAEEEAEAVAKRKAEEAMRAAEEAIHALEQEKMLEIDLEHKKLAEEESKAIEAQASQEAQEQEAEEKALEAKYAEETENTETSDAPAEAQRDPGAEVAVDDDTQEAWQQKLMKEREVEMQARRAKAETEARAYEEELRLAKAEEKTRAREEEEKLARIEAALRANEAASKAAKEQELKAEEDARRRADAESKAQAAAEEQKQVQEAARLQAEEARLQSEQEKALKKQAAKEESDKKLQEDAAAKEQKEKESYDAAVRHIGDQSGGFKLAGVHNFAASDVAKAVFQIPTLVRNGAFVDTVKLSANLLERSAAEYAQDMRSSVASFVKKSGDATDEELVLHLYRFFDSLGQKLAFHQKDASVLARKVQKALPLELKDSMSAVVPLVSLVATAPVVVDARRLKRASFADACAELSVILTNVSRYDNQLANVHRMVNTTATLATKMNGLMPGSSKEVKTFMNNLISTAYVETYALQDATHEVITKVGKVVSDRAHCTWSSSARSLGSGLTVMMAIAVASLSAFQL